MSSSPSSPACPPTTAALRPPLPRLSDSASSESKSLDSLPVHLDEPSKQLYLYHESVATALSGKHTLFVTAQKRARTSAKAAKNDASILSQIADTEAKLAADLGLLEGKKLRRRLFPNKTGEQLTKIRNNLTAVVEQSAIAKNTAAQSRRQARADASASEHLRADVEQLQHSEKARRDILEALFGGLAAGSVEENNIETERDRLVQVTNRAKHSYSAQKEAYHLLKASLENLKEARRQLWDAQITNTVDVFNGGGFGFVAGLSTQYRFQGAATVAQEAGDKIQRALDINPKLPIAKLVKVDKAVFLGLADIFFDGIVTDLVVRLTIEKAVKSISAVMESVSDSVECQRRIVEEAQGSFRGYSHELERKSDELTRVRADLLHEALQ